MFVCPCAYRDFRFCCGVMGMVLFGVSITPSKEWPEAPPAPPTNSYVSITSHNSLGMKLLLEYPIPPSPPSEILLANMIRPKSSPPRKIPISPSIAPVRPSAAKTAWIAPPWDLSVGYGMIGLDRGRWFWFWFWFWCGGGLLGSN
jgi:hypothetical protein